MSKKHTRKVRLSQFRDQVAEAVLPPDGHIEVEVADGVTLSIRIPISINDSDDDELGSYLASIRAAETDHELAKILLSEQDLEIWHEHGGTDTELAAIFASETQGARERLGKFRYNQSGS